MNRIESTSEDLEKPKPENNVFLPGRLFFTDRIELPTGISARERDDALEAQLEAKSPFPLDHLQYGVLYNDTFTSGFVYAIATDTLNEQQVATEPELFPSFLPFVGSCEMDAPCIVTALNGGELSLIVYDRSNDFPSEVHSISVDTSDPAQLQTKRNEVLKSMPWLEGEPRKEIHFFGSVEHLWNNGLIFHTDCGDKDKSGIDLELNQKQRLYANVSEADVKSRSIREARLSQQIWLLISTSFLGLLGVGVLALISLILSWLIQGKLDTVELRQKQIVEIEAKERNLQVFESGSAAQLQPLSMLELVNQLRPDGVYFNEVRASDGNQLQIIGVAENNGTTLVNQFRSSLESQGLLESVSVEITRINNGSSYYFNANLKFKHLELLKVGEHKS